MTTFGKILRRLLRSRLGLLAALLLPVLSGCGAMQRQHAAFRRDMAVVGQELQALVNPQQSSGVSQQARDIEQGLYSRRSQLDSF